MMSAATALGAEVIEPVAGRGRHRMSAGCKSAVRFTVPYQPSCRMRCQM
jgi:hypothetical protein